MKQKLFLAVLFLSITAASPLWSQTPDYRALRSEFEKAQDFIIDVEVKDTSGLGYGYTFQSGNEAGYYEIRKGTGVINVIKEIPDVMGEITEHNLVVLAESYDKTKSEVITVQIVDMYDYLVETTPHTEHLTGKKETRFKGPWTAYNNLWGIGSAAAGQDFRIGILITDNFPAGSMILWDVPGKAADFGGASVWNYTNFFMGNRDNMRTDVPGFPFKIADAASITMEFDMEPIVTMDGQDNFKVAMNTFLTDEDYLAPFSANDGDFFFVPDQIGTYIPSYPVVLDDITLGGKTFGVLYNENQTTGYQWRRVIVKNEEKLLQGPVDLLGLFNLFADQGLLDKQQSIYHLMFGIEVSDGFGAYKINNLDINISFDAEPICTLLGDSDGDGSITIIDALLTARESAGLNPEGFNSQCADVDQDGRVNIIDTLLIARYSAGIINSF